MLQKATKGRSSVTFTWYSQVKKSRIESQTYVHRVKVLKKVIVKWDSETGALFKQNA